LRRKFKIFLIDKESFIYWGVFLFGYPGIPYLRTFWGGGLWTVPLHYQRMEADNMILIIDFKSDKYKTEIVDLLKKYYDDEINTISEEVD